MQDHSPLGQGNLISCGLFCFFPTRSGVNTRARPRAQSPTINNLDAMEKKKKVKRSSQMGSELLAHSLDGLPQERLCPCDSPAFAFVSNDKRLLSQRQYNSTMTGRRVCGSQHRVHNLIAEVTGRCKRRSSGARGLGTWI